MQVGKSSRTDAFPKRIDRLAGGFHGPVDGNEFREVIDREVRAAFDFKVGGMGEITARDQVGDIAKHLGRDLSRVEQLLAEVAPHGVDVNPVVIGPHQTKIDPIDVAGLEEALLQTTLKKRPVLVVVPVKKEVIDAMIHGRIDLFLHHFGLGLILMAPDRNLGLLVVGKPGGGMADQLPLRPAAAMNLLVPWVPMVVGEIVTTHLDARACSHVKTLRHRIGLKP